MFTDWKNEIIKTSTLSQNNLQIQRGFNLKISRTLFLARKTIVKFIWK